MSMSKNSLSLITAGAIVLAASWVMPTAASAQLIFDWGGQEKVNDTGRQLVRINADAKPGEIIVSFTDRKLYLITAPGQALSYPVAIPREQDRWEGRTTVTQKRENPSWTPTPTMLKENPRLPRWVPGGHPMNPLGNRALYLGSSFYRIHGTDAPWTIGTAVSKGCIRMYNKDALDVYERTKVGAKVLVTWKNYQPTPEGEQPQTASREDATPAMARGNAAARDAAPAASQASVQSSSQKRSQESRYSDIFGTPEPTGPASIAREAAPDNDAQSRTPRATQPRAREAAPAQPQAAPQPQATPQREPRRPREAAQEQRPDAAKQAEVTPAAPRATEQRPRATQVETGSVPERRPRPKAATPAEAAPAQAAEEPKAAAAQPDLATRALEAAERAAAAAERAAAAAERAERAAAARAAAAPAATPAPE